MGLRLFGVLLALGLYACGSESDRPPVAEEGSVVVTPAGVAASKLRTGPCAQEGETVACRVETGRVGTIVNCFEGTQACIEGAWSACGEGDAGADAQ